jgi:hypothetical protein
VNGLTGESSTVAPAWRRDSHTAAVIRSALFESSDIQGFTCPGLGIALGSDSPVVEWYRTLIRDLPVMNGARTPAFGASGALRMRNSWRSSCGREVEARTWSRWRHAVLAQFKASTRSAGVIQSYAVKHVGPAKAAQIIAACLGQAIHGRTTGSGVVRSPEDVYALVGAEMALLEQEHLRVSSLARATRWSGCVTCRKECAQCRRPRRRGLQGGGA